MSRRPRPRQMMSTSSPGPEVEAEQQHQEDDEEEEKTVIKKSSGRRVRDDSSPRPRDDILGWVGLKELPQLPRIDKSDLVIASTHRYHGDLSSLKLRVRLLEYTTVDKNDKKDGRLAVMQDRVFAWQEKVEGSGNGDVPRLYSYVDTDSFTTQQGRKTAVIQRKSVVLTKSDKDEWEDVIFDIENEPENQGQRNQDARKKSTTPASAGQEQDRKQELREQRALLREVKKREEVEQRQAVVDDLLRQEEASIQGALGRNLKSKRPSTSLSNSLLLPGRDSKGQMDSDSMPKTRKGSFLRLPSFQRRTRAIERRRTRKEMISIQSQSMIILASIPDYSRRIVVCRLKALPTARIITIKAPFGFRVIHASKTKIYRLSWELHGTKRSSSPLQQEVKLTRPLKSFGMGVSFESVEHNEMRVWMMGEILSAQGFESEPLCVHFLLEIPPGWKNQTDAQCQGTTHSSYTTLDGVAHFSHHFSALLSFSMDALQHGNEAVTNPILLIMVCSIKDNGRVRHEGYGYASLPSTPGPHTLKLITWKPKARSIVERMQDVFLDATPSLEDIKAVHLPKTNKERPLVGNRLGLATEPSGQVLIRLHLSHHVPSTVRDQASKLELLEKMSSATILKSVQNVINAFNRARNKTILLKNISNVNNSDAAAY